jgi:hypothetical protein
VKILFDQGTPTPLRRALTQHVVVTAFEKGRAATSWPKIQLHTMEIVAAIDRIKPGDYLAPAF